MTGVPAVPGSAQLPLQVRYMIHAHSHRCSIHIVYFAQVLNQIVRDISKLDGISRVLYDLTAKPPGTTEWE